jgi:hypothetical protein
MENNLIQSGLGSSRVLISQGADAFDPNSLLDNEESLKPTPTTFLPLVILTLCPPHENEFQVGGILESLTTHKGEIVIEFIGLLPIALDLSYLALAQDKTSIQTLEVKQEESSCLEVFDFEIESVEISSIQENNKAKIKMVLIRASI